TDLTECIAVMTQLNKAACEAMITPGPHGRPLAHAATDITGFGLIGHAYEMATASNVSITIHAGAVPLMHDTLRLAEQGCLTRAHKSTLEYIGRGLKVEGVPEVLVNVLADAQTSGGLLI